MSQNRQSPLPKRKAVSVTPAGTTTPTPTVCAVSDYSITQSTGAVIVAGTTLVPNSNCNDCTAPFVLPFPVQFYNQTFTQARASSNGNLQFIGDNSLLFNSCLPNSTYNNVIYGYWDDLILDCLSGWGCGIYTSIRGSAPDRIFNIEWRAQRNEPPIGHEHGLAENAMCDVCGFGPAAELDQLIECEHGLCFGGGASADSKTKNGQAN